MNIHISRRSLIRTVSFVVAIIIVLSTMAYIYMARAKQAKLELEYHYMQSISELTNHVQNINSDLTKAMYANSPEMLNNISSKIWREAGFAKDCIASLPIEYLELQNTNKLLSQIGDYCVSLSKGFARGTDITEEQRKILTTLNNYSNTMLTDVLAVNDSIQTGSLSLTKVSDNINHKFDKNPPKPEVAEGFVEFEEGFTSYPTLIYDGPFSDHIMQKEPELIKKLSNVSRADAKKIAAKKTLIDYNKIKDGTDEDSKLASYGFYTDDADISITKKGGLLCYMLKSRLVNEQKISVKQAMDYARKYMDSLKIGILKTTYYEIYNNVITINYADFTNNIVVYTDLIKVSVALDTGEIMGIDARGYITNHMNRNDITPAISLDQAKQKVSKLLTIQDSQLCIIPSSGLNEILCYEFKCKAADGKNILVYINAHTGLEEQLLILVTSDKGQLTI